MPSDELYEWLGDASENLVQEAVYRLHAIKRRWPRWHETVAELAEFPSVPSRADAVRRLEAAICEGEVTPRLVRDGQDFRIELDRDSEDCVARRYLDYVLRRDRDAKERF